MEIGGNWPRIATFPAPLDLTLRNLIQNTIKHHDRETGHVQIRCADAGTVLEITVEDDGPGVAPEHHESIFMPFRTLGGSGGGMGLAIVQRTVKAVGGEIAVATNPPPQRGATFTVRWPKSHCD
jgi:signal transduction histidine kinase